MNRRDCRTIRARPLSAREFAEFGDVLEAGTGEPVSINQGACDRYSDLAGLEAVSPGRLGISIFRARTRRLPYEFDLMEKHPLGSQAFIPMEPAPFLVIAAADDGGKPARPLAFVAAPWQGINFRRGTWHGVLTPLGGRGQFAVVDRIGEGANLIEHRFGRVYRVVPE